MQRHATENNQQSHANCDNLHRRSTYQKVVGPGKRPIRGLWVRNGRFYAQLTITDAATGLKSVRRVPLVDPETKAAVTTIPQAQKQLERLRVHRGENSLPVLRRAPKFAEFVKEYLDQLKKRPGTIAKERGCLRLWEEHFGEARLHEITKPMVTSFTSKRQAAGMSGRTVNLDVIMLRNLMNKAVDAGWLRSLPMLENLRPLKWIAPRRELFSAAEIEKVCAAAVGKVKKTIVLKNGKRLERGRRLKNGEQFADYIRLLAYSGARRNEALRLKWADVSFERKQLTIGADGLTKNHEARDVNFNPKLAGHLQAMVERRAPDSEFLFPSPQRGNRDCSAKTFMETLRLVRLILAQDEKDRFDRFGFHDCRHFFISMCVMSGIDYMTIARWVGHKDGGVLIGKVYGHLSNEHAERQAERVNFGPVLVEASA